MLTIYGIKNCDTMKKAFALLDQQGLSYRFFDYKKQAPSAELLQSWIDQLGLDTVLNQRGTTWRKLTDAQKAQADTVEGAIRLMIAQPSMIKRPILQGANVLICGLDAARYQALLT
jgi:Spx/MgsR family transcriptional regulator